MSVMPTRFYSDKQEKKVAKVVGGKRTPNSGATPWSKSDIVTDKFAIECKTCTAEKKSFSIKREWLEKNKEEAFAMGKEYSVLAFNFGPDTDNYYILDENTFKEFKEVIENDESRM